MEFPFSVSDTLTIDQDGFVILDAAKMKSLSRALDTASYYNAYNKPKTDPLIDQLREILDKLGEASGRAQGLKQPITNYVKFVTSGDNRLYMKADGNRVYGLLKIGRKNLFHRDARGTVKEIKPQCVLDFYVHESVQRHGLGKMLYEKMLETENIEPHKLAIDRPSSKLINFMKKHYGLVNYVPQNNNFVIYNSYWDTSDKNSSKNRYEEKKGTGYTIPPSHPIDRKDVKQEQIPLPLAQDYSNRELQYKQADRGGAQNKMPIKNDLNEDFGLLSMQSNMKITENKIADTQQKIKMLNMEKQKLITIQEKRKMDYHSKAPWADTTDNFNSYKTSNTYGNHYHQQQPMSRNGR